MRRTHIMLRSKGDRNTVGRLDKAEFAAWDFESEELTLPVLKSRGVDAKVMPFLRRTFATERKIWRETTA